MPIAGRYSKSFQRRTYGPITIAIRARFEYDSTTIRLRYGYNTLQHATRFFVRSHTRSYTRISGRRVLHVDCQLNAHSFFSGESLINRPLKIPPHLQRTVRVAALCWNNYSAPDSGGGGIVMSVSVCLSVCVCLCVCLSAIISSDYTSNHYQIFVHVPYGVARSSSGGVVIRYVFPVL